MQKTVKAIVFGKVQGVFFRAKTQQQAKSLQLTGWVKNSPDGNVEVLASGNSKDIQQLLEWLKVGPPLAKVKEVVWEEAVYQAMDDFLIY